MNPCIDYCFNHFNKEYTKDCDNNCEYAKVIVKNKKLQADLARMTAERDAAITDLKKWSICATCKNYCPRNKSTHCRVKRAYLPGGNWAGCSNWQWRGQKED